MELFANASQVSVKGLDQSKTWTLSVYDATETQEGLIYSINFHYFAKKGMTYNLVSGIASTIKRKGGNDNPSNHQATGVNNSEGDVAFWVEVDNSDTVNQNDLAFEITDGTTTGTVIRHVNRANSMQLVITESPFTDLDSAIASVNAILATYMAAVGAQATNILGKITTSRSALMLDRTFDVRTLEEYTAESKDKMIRVLETELKQLKGE